VGRDLLIERYTIALRRTRDGRPGKSLLPIGLRGVGKTVLLNRFQEIAVEAGFSTGFVEAPEAGDLRAILAARLRTILLELDRGSVSSAVKRALGVLRSFSYQLPDGTRISLDVDAVAGAADSGVLADDLTDLFVSAGEAGRDRGRGLLLAIDELQYLTVEELGALIGAIHRTGQLGLPVMLVGGGLPQLPGLAGEAKSYAERLFEFPELGSLEPEDASDLLAIPAAAQGVRFDRDATAEIVALTEGYPYLLQEWGYHVWNAAPRSPVTLEDVLAAKPDVEQHLEENFFRVRMDRLTAAEKLYLTAMAQLGPGPHRSGDIAAQLGVKVESVAPRRSGLIRKGMLYSPSHGETAFTVPMFDGFLRRSAES